MKKTALITGVGRRLGNAISHQLLDQGWHVIGHYRTPSHAIDGLHQRGAELIQADLNDSAQTLALIERVQAANRLDLIVHNASCFKPEPTELKAKRLGRRMPARPRHRTNVDQRRVV